MRRKKPLNDNLLDLYNVRVRDIPLKEYPYLQPLCGYSYQIYGMSRELPL